MCRARLQNAPVTNCRSVTLVHFPILERIGQVAYKIRLPETSAIHPVFHVWLLRKALKATDQVSTTLPCEANPFVVPLQVMDHRRKTKANRVVEQVLICWSGEAMPDTWENLEELQSIFPCATAWGQAVPEGVLAPVQLLGRRPNCNARPSQKQSVAQAFASDSQASE